MSGNDRDVTPAPPPSSLDVTEQTYQWCVRVFAVAVCLVLLMIVGVMCFRVALDGNSAVTVQITQNLLGIVPWLAGTLVAAIVGAKGIATLMNRGG